MRVDPVLLNTVMFLCQEEFDDNGISQKVPRATAFLIRIEDGSLTWKYLVTARHNIERASDPIFVRFNKKAGGYDHFETRKSDWIPSDNFDVSCQLFYGPRKSQPEIDHASISIKHLVNDDYTYSGPPLTANSAPFQIGLGDDLAFAGLFSQHYGNKKMVPIVRFGNIAALPGDPIKVTLGHGDTSYSFDVIGFLAECASWGGHSGSPVFWTSTTFGRSVLSEGMKGPETLVPLNGLLGLVSAHFDIRQEAEATGDYARDAGKFLTPINSGIAVVTPSSAIRELLERGDVTDERRQDQEYA